MMRKIDIQCAVGFVYALAAAVVLSGCVAGDVKVDSNRKASIRQIAVHPVEPPPLVVPTNFTLNMERLKGFLDIGPGGLIVGGVAIAIQGESVSQEAQDWESYASRLESTQIWQPTKIVTQQVESHLKGRNLYDVQILLPMTKLFVGDKRELGPLSAYGPVLSWYNGDQAASGSLTADTDVVVEVGLTGYEIAQGQFCVAVSLRAVDPGTGEILGRARAISVNSTTWKCPLVPHMESLFANEAQRFKALFTNITERLTDEALRQLGL